MFTFCEKIEKSESHGCYIVFKREWLNKTYVDDSGNRINSTDPHFLVWKSVDASTANVVARFLRAPRTEELAKEIETHKSLSEHNGVDIGIGILAERYADKFVDLVMSMPEACRDDFYHGFREFDPDQYGSMAEQIADRRATSVELLKKAIRGGRHDSNDSQVDVLTMAVVAHNEARGIRLDSRFLPIFDDLRREYEFTLAQARSSLDAYREAASRMEKHVISRGAYSKVVDQIREAAMAMNDGVYDVEMPSPSP